MARFRLGDVGFYLNHIGLLLVLFAAGFGYADIERYMVRVDEGTTVQMGYDPATGHPVGLPVAVTLHDFEMEVWPAEVTGARVQPKRFASTLTVASPDGESVRGTAEVNSPLRFDGWMVYQSGYDSEAGAESAYSVVELVRDPWLWGVYVGFAMIAAGAVVMIWKGRRRYGLE
jgi:cytochrome c biogenesis protein ResB